MQFIFNILTFIFCSLIITSNLFINNMKNFELEKSCPEIQVTKYTW